SAQRSCGFPGRARGLRRECGVVATPAPLGARRDGAAVGELRLAHHGDRGSAEASSFRFGLSDGHWKLGWPGATWETRFNRKDGREVGWKSCRVDNFTGLDGAPHLLRDESARSN